MSALRLGGIAALVLSVLAGQAQGQERFRRHVRVVLDTSESMRKTRQNPGGNDPGRLAILSTLLLYDLVKPNPSQGDSFIVYPFDKTWRSGTIPSGPNQSRIAVGTGGREAFKSAIAGLTYDAPFTYFYPGLKTAIADLKGQGSALQDVRVIVLVTDGLPETPTLAEERQRILTELAPTLAQDGLRLYVLAFGPVAGDQRPFFEPFVTGVSGTSLGAVFADRDGGSLPQNMVQIFGESFGYTTTPPAPLPGTTQLDLAEKGDPQRVAVVAYTPGTAQPPEWELRAPQGGTFRTEDPRARSFGQDGGSYALRWGLEPDKGAYTLSAKLAGGRGQVMLLRPASVELKVLPRQLGGRSDMAVAELPLPLSVLVRLPGGASGDPGDVDLQVSPLGPWHAGSGGYGYRGSAQRYTFVPDQPFAPGGLARVTPEGRVYDVSPIWAWPEAMHGRPHYDGRLWIEARRRGTVVAAIVDSRAGRTESVRVYPRIEIKPKPGTALAGQQALRRGEQACTTFELEWHKGPLDPKRKYSLRAWIDQPTGRTDAATQELHEATFTVDGRRLDLQGQPAPMDSDWNRGVPLSAAELQGRHSVCVTLGRPTRGDASQPLRLPLQFRLLEAPYNDYADVVSPFTLQVLVAPPSPWERWRAWVLAAAALLALLALLWYLRDRPDVPEDLAYAVAFQGRPFEAPRRFEPAAFTARALGLVAERPLRAPGSDDVLARLRPVDTDLYHLRLERGVETLASDGRPSDKSARRAPLDVTVHQSYHLKTPRGVVDVRLEYLR